MNRWLSSPYVPYVQNFKKFLCPSSRRKFSKSRKLVSHGIWNKNNFPFGLNTFLLPACCRILPWNDFLAKHLLHIVASYNNSILQKSIKIFCTPISFSCSVSIPTCIFISYLLQSFIVYLNKVDQFPNFEKFQKWALFFLFLCQNLLYDSKSY